MIYTATVFDYVNREPYPSVGLVCACGRAVAGIEGVLPGCSGCGAVYLVSVNLLKFGAGRGSDTEGAAARNSRPTTPLELC